MYFLQELLRKMASAIFLYGPLIVVFLISGHPVYVTSFPSIFESYLSLVLKQVTVNEKVYCSHCIEIYSRTQEVSHSPDGRPNATYIVTYTFPNVGRYQVKVNVSNAVSSLSVVGYAHVEEPITGVQVSSLLILF